MYTIKDRIFEKLSTAPEPAGYSGRIPWIVQQQISATNGIHFKDNIGKLKEYPIPEIPITNGNHNNLLLDIGCGWGRWLVAASRKNFIPVGIDLRLEFCKTARKVVQDNGSHAYTVVADLQHLPFQDNVFDIIWSFSVIQHTHYDRLTNCLRHIERMLKSSGYCFLEFPNKQGMRNRFGPAAGENNMDFDSWDVRYYTPSEYQRIFLQYFDNFQYFNHSALGIGILPGDLKYAHGIRNKAIIVTSRTASRIIDLVKPLKAFSDSIYIKSVKRLNSALDMDISLFLKSHMRDPENNLNIASILRCPATGNSLRISEDHRELINSSAGLAYPIVDGIPVMIVSEARTL